MSNDVNNNNGDGHDKDKDKDYEVGFCKPPKATQFQKGQSGNPKGRPKGSKNKKTVLGALRMAHKDFRDVIMDEAMKEVEVKENGEIVTTSKLRLVAGQLMNKGIRGETRAAREAIRLAEKAILDEHKDVARFIEAERREREQLKQLWLHHSKTADEEISDDGEIRHETGHSAFVQMMAIYDRFMDKKSMRFALGEDKVPMKISSPGMRKNGRCCAITSPIFIMKSKSPVPGLSLTVPGTEKRSLPESNRKNYLNYTRNTRKSSKNYGLNRDRKMQRKRRKTIRALPIDPACPEFYRPYRCHHPRR